jgi:hypothetical protein
MKKTFKPLMAEEQFRNLPIGSIIRHCSSIEKAIIKDYKDWKDNFFHSFNKNYVYYEWIHNDCSGCDDYWNYKNWELISSPDSTNILTSSNKSNMCKCDKPILVDRIANFNPYKYCTVCNNERK